MEHRECAGDFQVKMQCFGRCITQPRSNLGRLRFFTRGYAQSSPAGPPAKPPPGSMKRMWKRLFGRYLLVTNTISSGLLMMLGDVVAQKIEMKRDGSKQRELDWYRLGCMTLVGISQGPLHHYLYLWMDRALPGTAIRTVLTKIGIDQFVISPIFITTYLYSAGILEGNSVRACTDEITDKFATIYVADWLVWPPTQFINFYWLSPKYRVLYINGITMLYNIFLCYIKHNDDLRIRFDKSDSATK
ncbi:AAEL000666-PA [Aedes aegypti]|uniref:AAEL000666-PA n=1 Tax=Aedes aegypti TaxID=7159 RepID=Q17NN7_AEDAE|nr:AAEL000666-PA [Aedes aegypti]